MKVAIIDKITNKNIITYTVTLRNLTSGTSENDSEYFKIAWESGVDDGYVNDKHKERYRFELS